MRLRFMGILTVLLLLAAACSGGDSEPASDGGAQEPETQPEEAAPETAPPPTEAPEPADESEEPATEDAPSATEVPEPAEEPQEAPEPTEDPEEPEPIVLTDSFRGVTAEAIKIGVVIIDVEIFGRDNGDVEAKWQAVIDDVNANGGVLGRRLDPVIVRYSPLGDAETEAACVELTQDEQVFAATGPLLTNLTCFTDVNDTIFINTFGVSQEEFDRSKAVAVGPGALPARSAAISVEALIAAGALDGPVGVHAAADTGSERDHYVDALMAAGVDVVSETASTVGGGDVAASEAEMQAFAQRWRADGAEIILAVGIGSGLNVIAGLDRSPFRPAVVLTNSSDLDPQLYRDLGYTTDALEGAVAIGSLGFEDLAQAGEPSVVACIERFEAASGEIVNISPEGDEPVNLNTTIWACQGVEIFSQIAIAAGPDLTNDSFRAAAEGGLSLKVTANSSASISAGKFDISDGSPILLAFDPAADDFVSMG
ncbi:hypothetical protein [Candidatus Poriferisocius sp.]|uniref:hypothetical protein n=1 Tax=Candidatus Poriferisocius sp. TaxID=3101276 RepID=UPI003B01CD16